MTIIKDLPEEIKKHIQWCVYKIEPPQKEGQHERKIPINPITGDGASSSDPNTWVDFDTAYRLYKESNEYDGLGFFFNNDYIGIDIDDIPEEIKAFKDNPNNPNNTINWLNRLTKHSYLEVSQSGNGIHAIVKGSYTYTANRKDNYEIYGKRRFFALTGNILNNQRTIKTISKNNLKDLYTSTVGRDANKTQKLVEVKQEQPISNSLSIEEIINKMYASSRGVQIKHLMDGNIEGYVSDSEADMALCNFLAFWTSKDPNKMDAIFRKSKLMRPKWDEMRGAMTYGQLTIEKAIQDTPNAYTGELVATSTEGEYNFEFNEEPETMEKLFSLLKNEGTKQRKFIAESEPKKQKNTIPARTVANIIERYVITANIGTTQEELEKSPLFFYNVDTGIYSFSSRTIDKLIIAVEPCTTTKNRTEIKNWLSIDSPNLEPSQDINLIAVGNGIYDKKSKKLLPFSPKKIFTTKIETSYSSEQIEEPIFNGWSITKWIKELSDGDNNKENLIWQTIATVIQNPPTANSAFFLVDDQQGRTGKSTFEELLINLVGEENFTTLRIKQFDERFSIANIYNTSLVIGDDNNPNDFIEDSSNFKSAVTGDRILLDIKSIQPFKYKPNITTVQSMNGIPRFKDNTGGVYRRFKVIKFNHQYPDTPDSKLIKSKYIKDNKLLQFVLKKGLETDISTITDTKESNDALDEQKSEDNPIYAFCKDIIINLTSSRIPTKFLYKLYQKYCVENNLKYIPTQNKFTRDLKTILKTYGYTLKSHCRPTKKFTHEDYQLIICDNYKNTKYDDYINRVQTCFIKE